MFGIGIVGGLLTGALEARRSHGPPAETAAILILYPLVFALGWVVFGCLRGLRQWKRLERRFETPHDLPYLP